MKYYNNLYEQVISIENLRKAYKNARKGKSAMAYVVEFEKHLDENLEELHNELKGQAYSPLPMQSFILRDPKTRRISKSAFRDRIVHHALCNIIEPIFDKMFIYDSCANRIGKGALFALERFDKFIRIVSKNGKVSRNRFGDSNHIQGYCLKADIRHYFDEVNHGILLRITSNHIKDAKVLWLVKKIIANLNPLLGKGMPLGNLTSQFFANVYLNELDYFVKHRLKARFYIRYVDDFVILHNSKEQLEEWKCKIDNFLREKLKIELHPDKSKIIPLSRGIDFVGFRNFYYFRLLRKRNIRKIILKIRAYKRGEMPKDKILESFQGWNAYAKWADSFKLRRMISKSIYCD